MKLTPHVIAAPVQVLRWLGYLVLQAKPNQPPAEAFARITVHSSALDREDRDPATPILADPGIDRDGVERARLAWLRAMGAYVRASQTHQAAAMVHARLGHPKRAAVASERAAAERSAYEAAIAAHPEWAADAPDGQPKRCPELCPDDAPRRSGGELSRHRRRVRQAPQASWKQVADHLSHRSGGQPRPDY